MQNTKATFAMKILYLENQKGAIAVHTKSMAIAPFWLSADDMLVNRSTAITFGHHVKMPYIITDSEDMQSTHMQ